MAVKNFLFVGGDVSGIQKFIYNISSKKAAVSLKGRSAYLSQYTQEVCDRIKNLPSSQSAQNYECIYCSGGKFYIILSDSPQARKELSSLSVDVENELWKKQHGQLGIALGILPFSTDEVSSIMDISKVYVEGKDYGIGELWRRMTMLFNAAKSRKFSDLLLQEYNSFFDVIPVGESPRVCAITGLESDQCIYLDSDKDGNGIMVLPEVKEQVELGQKLRREENFKTFEEYADGSKLGVLRMDVDFLGRRFIQGFNSFKEYSLFSGRLGRFFSNTVREVQRNDFFCDNVNIIYAGGDDLFAVGKWDKVIDFAQEVHDRFALEFEADGLSISGGMSINSPKFPISKAAQRSGDAEEMAKEHRDSDGNVKNAFCFFGESVSWKKDFPIIKALKDDFVREITDHALSRGILQRMMQYAEVAVKGEDMSYQWQAVYYLSRMLERCPKDSRDFVKHLRDSELTKGIDNYRLIALACRWAELSTRFN